MDIEDFCQTPPPVPRGLLYALARIIRDPPPQYEVFRSELVMSPFLTGAARVHGSPLSGSLIFAVT